jgi:hypothetical protein
MLESYSCGKDKRTNITRVKSNTNNTYVTDIIHDYITRHQQVVRGILLNSCQVKADELTFWPGFLIMTRLLWHWSTISAS